MHTVGHGRPPPSHAVDQFLLDRLADEERRACLAYRHNHSRCCFEKSLITCEVRRKLVLLYRLSEGTEKEGLLDVIKLVAELYSDHSEYQAVWAPHRADARIRTLRGLAGR